MALGETIRRVESEFKIVEAIENRFASVREDIPMDPDEGWMRVSSLGYLCERQETLHTLYNIGKKEEIKGAAIVNFAYGDATHSLFQNKLLPETVAFLGRWRCSHCGTNYGSRKTRMVPRPDFCVRCGALAREPQRVDGRPDEFTPGEAFIYIEEWVGNHQYRIGGSPDGQYVIHADQPHDEAVLTEFKSANDDNYKKYVKAPDLAHVLQANTYLWLTGLRQAKIIYYNKAGLGTRDMCEHDLQYDEEMMNNVLSVVENMRQKMRERKVMDRERCGYYACQAAKYCPTRDLCFDKPADEFIVE
jgi:hypothetical protein